MQAACAVASDEAVEDLEPALNTLREALMHDGKDALKRTGDEAL